MNPVEINKNFNVINARWALLETEYYWFYTLWLLCGRSLIGLSVSLVFDGPTGSLFYLPH